MLKSAVLSLFLLLSWLCCSPLAAQSSLENFGWDRIEDAAGNEGIIINEYKGTETTVTFPDTIEGLPVIAIYTEIFEQYPVQVTSVVLPKHLQWIGYEWFQDGEYPYNRFTYDRIFHLSISDSNPNFCVVDDVLFSKDMSTLYYYPICDPDRPTSYTIPSGVRTIAEQAFGVSYPEYPEYDDSMEIVDWKKNTPRLKELMLPKTLEYIEYYAFYNTGSIERFYFLGSVPELAFGREFTSEQDDYTWRRVFGFDSSWSTLPTFGGLDVEYINNALVADDMVFIFDEYWVEIDDDESPDGYREYPDGYGLTYIIECGKTDVVIPSTFQGKAVTGICYEAFYGCVLNSITIPSSVKYIEGLWFGENGSVAEYRVAGGKNFIALDGVLYNYDKTHLVGYPSGKKAERYVMPSTCIGSYEDSLSDCHYLKSITFSKAFTTFGIDGDDNSEMDGMLEDCPALEEIIVPTSNKFFASKDGVLYNKSFTKIWLYPLGKKGTTFTLPSTVTRIGEDAFGCTYNISEALLEQLELRTVIMPASVSYIEMEAMECSNVRELFFLGQPPTLEGDDEGWGEWLDNGKCHIKAYANTGWEKYAGGTFADVPVFIVSKMTDLSLEAETNLLLQGETCLLTAYANHEDGEISEVAYPSWSITSGSAYASIDLQGRLTAKTGLKADQTLTVKATVTEGSVTKSATTTITLLASELTGLYIDLWKETLANGESCCLEAYVTTIWDDDPQYVPAVWSIVSGKDYATIDQNGCLTAKSVSDSQTVTVQASYTDGVVTKTATATLTIIPSPLDHLEIVGPISVKSGKSAQYTAYAHYENGTSQEVTPAWAMLDQTPTATISAKGLLTALDGQYTHNLATLQATYTEHGITSTETVVIDIEPLPPYLVGLKATLDSRCILAGKSMRLTAQALYNVGAPKAVNASWSLLEGSDHARLSADGATLIVSSVLSDSQGILLRASYTEDGRTFTEDVSLMAIPADFTGMTFGYTYLLRKGWQSISIVLRLDDASQRKLLQNFIIFTFDVEKKRYMRAERLESGQAYWLYAEQDCAIQVTGAPLGTPLATE